VSADMEIILVANEIFKNFGAINGKQYEIHVSSRRLLDTLYDALELDEDTRLKATRLADRKNKMEPDEFKQKMQEAVGDKVSDVLKFLNADNINVVPEIIKGTPAHTDLQTLITTMAEIHCPLTFDPTIIRGFDYYTGVVFEVVDLDPKNNRAMMGGGRYDNLTALFGGEPISGIGFGFGDVTLKDFLISHDLMTTDITSVTLAVLPTSVNENIAGQKVAQAFREAGIATAVDLSAKKVGKKISVAAAQFINYVLVLGEEEIKNKIYVVKDLMGETEFSGTLEELIEKLSNNG
jgi:histidyl-tRNA synthetase